MKDSDLTINTYPPRNKGGQYVGIPLGIHLTHEPTGIQVIVSTERSQSKNKKIAQSMIEWGLTEIGWKDQHEHTRRNLGPPNL
jgi:protein subunit release factor A